MKMSNLLVLSLLVAPVVVGGGGIGLGCGREGPSPADAGPNTGDAGDAGVPDAGPSPDSCNGKNCPEGCCLEGTCVTNGNLDHACGSMGQACARCELPLTCEQENESGGHGCLLDPGTRWSLQATSATIPPLTPTGNQWDSDNDKPDVQVTLDCPVNGSVNKLKTEEVASFTPTFTTGICVTTALELQKAPITLKLVDIDGLLDSDDDILTTTHTFTVADFVAGTIDVPIPGNGNYGLTLKLTPQ